MSRSYRKHPIRGFGSDSEKFDKHRLNKRLRKKAKQILEEGDYETPMPIKEEILDEWDMVKDGKGWILDENNKKEMSK